MTEENKEIKTPKTPKTKVTTEREGSFEKVKIIDNTLTTTKEGEGVPIEFMPDVPYLDQIVNYKLDLLRRDVKKLLSILPRQKCGNLHHRHKQLHDSNHFCYVEREIEILRDKIIRQL